MLYRKIESTIEDHLKSRSTKILLIDGARQVGKTYIIRHVGILYGNNIRAVLNARLQRRGKSPICRFTM